MNNISTQNGWSRDHGRRGGRVVRVLVFYSVDLISNPTEVYIFILC